MELSASEQATLRQYLLGQGPEAELSRAEERLMTDSASYEELLILEDELVDQYIHGQLSEPDRVSFESYFLRSPDRREKVRFARALNKYVGLTANEQQARASETKGNRLPFVKALRFSVRPFQNPILNYALAAGLVVMVVGVSWLVLRSLRATANDPGKIFAVMLTPGGATRGDGDIQVVSVPPGIGTVRLQLLLPTNQASDYSVRLLAGDGNIVWQGKGLKPTDLSGKRLLEVDVPTELLKRDTYRLKLGARSSGSYEEITSYNFRLAN